MPPFPAKEKDNNFKEYYQTTGLTQAWELDALPPDKLSELFENAIAKFTDFTELKRLREKENGDKSYFKNLLSNVAIHDRP